MYFAVQNAIGRLRPSDAAPISGMGVIDVIATFELHVRRYHGQKRADPDLVDAQCVLGVAYAEGVSVPHDDREAINWLRKAAAQGVAWIQNRLATMYQHGEGTARDDVEAVKWYRAAAQQDEPRAEYNLAYMYFQGYGVRRDNAVAVIWYRKAAEHGHIGAQDSLGSMYQYGYGVAEFAGQFPQLIFISWE